MKPNTTSHLPCAAALLLALGIGSAHAGRPLVVDDADVNDAGHGHLETWIGHAGGFTTYNLSPAFAPIDGLELGAVLSREPKTSTTVSAVQAKWRITAANDNGCNLGAVGGLAHEKAAGTMPYVNGLLTCNNAAWGSLHVNVGAAKPKGASALATWGLALEKPFGPVVPHVEFFWSEGAKPTVQVGLRGDIADSVQLDGSIGRSDGVTVYTLGLKFQF